MGQERGIRYFPIGLFASVMGFAGVTIAWRNLEEFYGWNSIVSTVSLLLTTVLYLFNAGILIYRLIRHIDDVKTDFNHPIKVNFFAAVSISMLLLSAAYSEIHYYFSYILWILGAILQLVLTLVILSRLIWTFSFKIEQFNPAWFIPIVGNIVVPIAGVFHAPMEVNWLFFSTGIFFSIIYLTLFFYRAFFYPPLPDKLLPTFFILMAPPAVGSISYEKITKSMDTFTFILYGIAFMIGLLLLFQLKRFLTIPFFITWWAFLFPSAAMTLATFQMYTASEQSFYGSLWLVQMAGLTLLTLYLLWKTIQLALQRKLCVKD